MVQGGRAREVPPGETAPMVFWVPRLTPDVESRLLALTFRLFSTGYFTGPPRGTPASFDGQHPPMSSRKIARITPYSAKQARDSRPRHSTQGLSTMFIPVDPCHENRLSPFQPKRRENRPKQARTETDPKNRGV